MTTTSGSSTRSVARRLGVWLSVLALVLAPMIVHLTHGPSAAMVAEVSTWHGHVHGDISGGLFVDHDPADHEHVVTGLVAQPGAASRVRLVTQPPVRTRAQAGIIRDGPRRPPRVI
ncbi:hypothetical protein [Brevirhabdus sp.]|uniref:hypothetical protein n=1 Tax=Brevirhabdus sp. TaxID=2004514 RepID=UPI004059D4F4